MNDGKLEKIALKTRLVLAAARRRSWRGTHADKLRSDFFPSDKCSLPIRAVNRGDEPGHLCSARLSWWSWCETSNSERDGSSPWCLVSVCLCMCVCVFSWYCIYTPAVYTTHTPHIDHPLNSNNLMAHRSPLGGETSWDTHIQVQG